MFWGKALLVLAGLCAAHCSKGPRYNGKVTVRIHADQEQPVGMPVIIRVIVKNTGDQPIHWHCGISESLPSPIYFDVEARYQGEAEWETFFPTNWVESISGHTRSLGPEDFVSVPLVIPIRPKSVAGHVGRNQVHVANVEVRVKTRLDETQTFAETKVAMMHDPSLTEKRQYQMIAGMMGMGPDGFWRRVAIHHADEAVISMAVLLAQSSNKHVVRDAYAVLSKQTTIPQAHAGILTRVMKEHAARSALEQPFIDAALATKSEIARNAVLEMLAGSTDDSASAWLVEALSKSPGDHEWLQRARTGISQVRPRIFRNDRLAEDVARVLNELDQRLARP
jgi:hypothetical protein